MSFPMADGLQLLQQHVTWHIAGLQGDHDGCDVPILPAPILSQDFVWLIMVVCFV